MRYLLMISAEETEDDSPDPLPGTALATPDPTGQLERRRAEGVAAFTAWLDDLMARGVLRAHEGLWPSRTATTVRVRGDQVLLTDGPYIEAKEQIGGFALIEVEDLDEAIEVAACHPACAWGQVEVRPLREL
ncbi:MAG: hypothetical protein QOE59_1399 [Actinomycetota bacterium]|nr:hypothetical protein [Actinomycetota bacterium]